MSLTTIFSDNPKILANKSVEQIVAIAGDGKLRDGSECSREFRSFLSLQSLETLKSYTDYCLEAKLDKGGAILQDVVNEMGRRIGYNVTNGRYSGIKQEIGFDGLWFDGANYIIVEVKTTDAYRINLDTILNYADRKAKEESLDEEMFSSLIVVGRQDTGDLEAQIRGSKHAWRARIISIEALAKLMWVRRELAEETLINKIKRVLLPFEYTRVDEIIDLVFETQAEVEQQRQADVESIDEEASNQRHIANRNELSEKKMAAVSAVAHGEEIERISSSLYRFPKTETNIACAVSKRYPREGQPYWYAFHPKWLAFMNAGKSGFLILTCMDRNEAFKLPAEFMNEILVELNTTKKEDREYWHIALCYSGDELAINLSKTGRRVSIQRYAYPID